MRAQSFLDLEDGFISRIGSSQFEVVFTLPSTASVAAEDACSLHPRRTPKASVASSIRCGDLLAACRVCNTQLPSYLLIAADRFVIQH